MLTALHGHSSALQQEAPSGPPSHLGSSAGSHPSAPQTLGIPNCFQGGGAYPLWRGAGRSVAVRGGWVQWVWGGHGVRPALGAPSTGCRGGRRPAGEQDTWGAKARGLGQAQGWGLRSPVPQHPGQTAGTTTSGGSSPHPPGCPLHHTWCLPQPSHPCPMWGSP